MDPRRRGDDLCSVWFCRISHLNGVTLHVDRMNTIREKADASLKSSSCASRRHVLCHFRFRRPRAGRDSLRRSGQPDHRSERHRSTQRRRDDCFRRDGDGARRSRDARRQARLLQGAGRGAARRSQCAAGELPGQPAGAMERQGRPVRRRRLQRRADHGLEPVARCARRYAGAGGARLRDMGHRCRPRQQEARGAAGVCPERRGAR